MFEQNVNEDPFAIMTVGPKEAGKTAVCQIIAGKDFNFAKYEPTKGIDTEYMKQEKGHPQIVLWDTPEPSRVVPLQTLLDGLKTSSHALVIMVPVVGYNKTEFTKEIKKWFDDIAGKAKINAPILVVGTKADLRHAQQKQVSFEEAKQAVKEVFPEQTVEYIECSAKTKKNIPLVKKTLIKMVETAAKIKQPQDTAFEQLSKALTKDIAKAQNDSEKEILDNVKICTNELRIALQTSPFNVEKIQGKYEEFKTLTDDEKLKNFKATHEKAFKIRRTVGMVVTIIGALAGFGIGAIPGLIIMEIAERMSKKNTPSQIAQHLKKMTENPPKEVELKEKIAQKKDNMQLRSKKP